MTRQTTIFGGDVKTDTDLREAERIIEKFPAAKDHPGLFFYRALLERAPWIAQIPEDRQLEIRGFCNDIESLRRRRQDVRAKDDRAAAGQI